MPRGISAAFNRFAKKCLPTSGYWRRQLVGLRHAPDRHPQSKRSSHDDDIRLGQMAGAHLGRRGRNLDQERRTNGLSLWVGSRFEDKPGSNPEELIGAAHAACFTMTLSRILGEAELIVEHTETKAEVTLEKQGDGFAITSVHLTLLAKIPGADKAKFVELVDMAKAGCPVSRLLNAKITLEAKLL